MKNICITGGCGFIGAQLAKHIQAVRPETQITLFDNMSVGSPAFVNEIFEDSIPSNIKFIEGDIRNFSKMTSALVDITHVVHLAANTGVRVSIEQPELDKEVNVSGTFNVLKAALENKVQRVILASSGAVVGPKNPPMHEEMVPKPASPYAASKLATEVYASAFYHTWGLSSVALRFSNVYGPGSQNKGSLVAKFLRHAILGHPFEIYGNGEQTRDFIYISDLCDAVISAIENTQIEQEVFQISTGIETSVNEAIEQMSLLLQEYGLPVPKVSYTSQQPGELMKNHADPSKAHRLLNWKARVDLQNGLRETISALSKTFVAWGER